MVNALKRQLKPEKATSSKKRKDESILSTEINELVEPLIVMNVGNRSTCLSLEFSLPEFNLKKQICTSWAFHVDDRSESSSTYDMIIGNVSISSWAIRHNHELQ
jgi:ribosomal protein S26